jgi:hypothetical protein
LKIFGRTRPKFAFSPCEARGVSLRPRAGYGWARAGLVVATLAAAQLLGSCNDLTDPLPGIAGTYTYQSRSSDFVRLNRNGVITIDDFDRRTAAFSGTFDFVNDAGEHVTGGLLGSFVTRDHIYFRFLTSHFEFHEGDYALGRANGEIFFQGITYESSGSTFSLIRRLQ